jgi:hypothetical protein
MASKKKRNKKYSGPGAAEVKNVVRVHKKSAVVRSDRAQWFVDHKKLVRNVVIGALIVIAVVAVFVGFFTSGGTK